MGWNSFRLADSAISFRPSSRFAIQPALIIAAQYSMLIDNQGYQFEKCEIASDMIVQEVIVTTDEQVFNLTYRLSIKGSTLGVEAAIVNAAEPKLNI